MRVMFMYRVHAPLLLLSTHHFFGKLCHQDYVKCKLPSYLQWLYSYSLCLKIIVTLAMKICLKINISYNSQ